MEFDSMFVFNFCFFKLHSPMRAFFRNLAPWLRYRCINSFVTSKGDQKSLQFFLFPLKLYQNLTIINNNTTCMRTFITVILLLLVHFIPAQTFAQINLVPNPSFEQYDTCPNAFTQMRYAVGWESATGATPDYWNACDTGIANVPNNVKGFQPARSGDAFAGVILTRNNTLFPPLNQNREYIRTELNQALVAGRQYCVTFYVNRADSCDWATGNIGVYFSVNPDTNYSTTNVLLYTPQVANNPANIIADNIGWTKISGSFIAAGGERHIMIGNFNTFQTSNVQFIGGCFDCNGEPELGYYYVDDICVFKGDCNSSCTGDISPVVDSCLQRSIPFSIAGDSCYSAVKWNFGDPGSGANNTSSQFAVSHKFSSAGLFVVTAIVNFTCITDTISTTVNIVNCDSIGAVCDFEIPNVFTPNGDGISDRFEINVPCPLELFEFFVFDRWGGRVFETSSLSELWNGTHKGADCAEGVYFYTLNYSFNPDKVLKKSGSITLLR
jgi:gliding motility-associated-like protein